MLCAPKSAGRNRIHKISADGALADHLRFVEAAGSASTYRRGLEACVQNAVAAAEPDGKSAEIKAMLRAVHEHVCNDAGEDSAAHEVRKRKCGWVGVRGGRRY